MPDTPELRERPELQEEPERWEMPEPPEHLDQRHT